MTEPDVTLTDYALTAECVLLAWMLWRWLPLIQSTLRLPFITFFAAAAIGSAAGGTVHGFFLSNASSTGTVLWRTALIAIGVSAWCAWTIAAQVLFDPRIADAVRVAALIEFVVYAAIVAFVSDRF